MRRSLLSTIACSALVLVTLVMEREAFADDARSAGELFRSGEEAYAERRFRDAASAFDEANRKAPRGATAYAAGVSWHEAGEPARAADALELALETGGLDDESRVDARTRLARISPLLATMTVDGPPGARVTLAHMTDAAVPLKIHLAPGRHVAKRADVAGAPSIKIVVAAGESARVVLSDVSIVEDDPPPPSSFTRTAGWVGIGAAGVFSASAVVLGLATLKARDDFSDSGNTDASMRDRALSFRTMTNVAWAAAAASGLGGITLLVLSPRASAAKVQLGATELRCTIPFL
ncbi:MAG: hypothetical protein BGO98_34555 [Myxococcales bacterium 68-20]|nr:MAG: hypothetical protein BGO98_34555 [Myxococcales bacterium 68-20]